MEVSNRSIPDSVEPTFRVFTHLPIELRHIIWRLTLRPRLVEITWESDDDREILSDMIPWDSDDEGEGVLGCNKTPTNLEFVSYSPLPAALAVCQDSRDAVLGLYPLCFAAGERAPRIRFNFSIDRLLLHEFIDPFLEEFFHCLNATELAKIKYLAVYEYLGLWFGYSMSHCAAFNKSWEKIEGLLDRLQAIEEKWVILSTMIAIDDEDMDPAMAAKLDDERLDKPNQELYTSPEFPRQLRFRYKLTSNNIPDKASVISSDSPILKKAELVWGWRLKKHKQFVLA